MTEDNETRSETREAKEFLADLLRDGRVKQADATKKAKACGITDKSLRTARERLGVKSRKVGFGTGGSWVWELPTNKDAQAAKDAYAAQPLRPGTLGTLETNGHLRDPGVSGPAPDAEVF